MKYLIGVFNEKGIFVSIYNNLFEDKKIDNIYLLTEIIGDDFNNLIDNLKRVGFFSSREIYININNENILSIISGIKLDNNYIIFVIQNENLKYLKQYDVFMSDQTNIIRDYTKEIANLKYREEKLLKEAAELSNEIARLNRELVKKSKELEYLSYHDHLTKAFNRNYLDEFAVSDFKRARRYDEDLSIVYIDLDNFKLINDRYGHFYGDQVLKKFVEITSNNIRKYIDKLIRYGGDEFILILIKSNLDFAHKTVKRIEEILNQNNIFISYGIVNIKNFPNHDFEDLIKYAEDLMYKAKMEKKTNL